MTGGLFVFGGQYAGSRLWAHGELDPGRSNSPAVYIFAGALATVFSGLTAEAGQAKQAMWLDPRLLFRVLTISFIGQKAIAALLPPNFRAASSMSLVPVDRNSAHRKVLDLLQKSKTHPPKVPPLLRGEA